MELRFKFDDGSTSWREPLSGGLRRGANADWGLAVPKTAAVATTCQAPPGLRYTLLFYISKRGACFSKFVLSDPGAKRLFPCSQANATQFRHVCHDVECLSAHEVFCKLPAACRYKERALNHNPKCRVSSEKDRNITVDIGLGARASLQVSAEGAPIPFAS